MTSISPLEGQDICASISRVEGFVEFASDKLAAHQIQDLRAVVRAARAAPTLVEALVDAVAEINFMIPFMSGQRKAAARAVAERVAAALNQVRAAQ